MFGAISLAFDRLKRRAAKTGSSPSLRCEFGQATDIGRRQTNEDSILIDDPIGLALVADGMGGHEGGEIASRMAVDIVRQVIAKARPSDIRDAEQVVVTAVDEANKAIFTANQNAGATGAKAMGTTIVGSWRPDPNENRAIIFNVGDSRAYLFRDGKLLQLSQDHTLYQQWLDGGSRGPAPDQHYLVACLGNASEVRASRGICRLIPGDILLLCTDGCYPHLAEIRLGAAFGAENSVYDNCRDIVSYTQDSGEGDNISLVAIRFRR